MKKFLTTLTIGAIALASALPVMAQQRRLSPHETISAVIDGNRVTVTYGRPYTKNPRGGELRKIWGGLVTWATPGRRTNKLATTRTHRTKRPMSGT